MPIICWEHRPWILEKAIPQKIKEISNTPENLKKQEKWYLHYSLMKEQFELGILYILINEQQDGKKAFTEAVNNGITYFDLVKPIYDGKGILGLAQDDYMKEFSSSLFFSGNRKVLNKYSKEIIELIYYGDSDGMLWDYQMNRAFHKLIINNYDLEQEIEFFTEIENRKHLPSGFKFSYGYFKVLQGLKENAKSKVIEGLTLILKKFNNRYCYEYQNPISEEACKIYSLAKLRGISILDKEIEIKFWRHIPLYIRALF